MRIAVMIGYRDRPTELALLLESLWRQTYREFDIFVSDDNSGTPIQTYHFLMCMVNKLNETGNFVFYDRNGFNLGVSKNRQKLVDWAMKGDYPYLCRVDDDVILEPDFLERLVKVINEGYDLASGVTPFIGQAQFKRDSKFIGPVINRVVLDKEGNFVMNGDDCGMEYLYGDVLPTHHFRSSALYKREIHEKVNYDSRLTKHGFREEEIFSFKCIINGFKLGVDTMAIAWHLMTPSGGERFPEQNEMVKQNEQILKEWVKDMYLVHGDFISKYNESLGIKVDYPSKEELSKPTNLIL